MSTSATTAPVPAPVVPAAPAPVRLRALVVSDIHAVPDSKPTRSSWADMSDPNNPIEVLGDYLQAKGVTADVVLCPGDLGHQAHPAAATWAWQRLQTIGAAVGANHVIATTGNHDIDSRHQNHSLDPSNHLKGLVPHFPLASTAADYWAYSMGLVVENGWRIVTLNSCFHHNATESEHERGRIEEPIISQLDGKLTATDAGTDVNILLCHHHPMPHTELDLEDASAMFGGDRLLDLLDRDRHGRWLVLHGHKHFPWVRYAPGSSISPVLFSAASAGVLIHDPLITRVRNQVHLIEFDTAQTAAIKLHMAARFESWLWAFGTGWQPSPMGNGLPGRGGFGFRVDLRDLAQRIAAEHFHRGAKVLHGTDLEGIEPRLPYLAPIDIQPLSEILERDHAIRLRQISDGTISDTTSA